ncbi:MAG TPA: hypothetical protein GX711_07095, partial [Clostridia bacterium]|nr:hypothetical protein [Clostridia bacterium]
AAEDLLLPLLQMPDASYVDVIVPLMTAILDNQVQALEYAQEIHRQMTSILFSGKGLAEIAYTLSMLIGHTVVLTDREHTIKALAVHDNEDVATAEILRQCLLPEVSLRNSQVIPYQVLADAYRNQKPTYYSWKLASGQRETLFFPVIAGREHYGMVIVLGLQEKLEAARLVAIEAATMVISLAIIKENAITEAEDRLRLDFYNELFLTGFPTEENALTKARQLGLSLENKRAVLVIEVEGLEILPTDLGKRLCRTVERVVSQNNPRGIVVNRGQGIVILLDYGKQLAQEEIWSRIKKFTYRLKDAFTQEFPKIPVRIGVGELCENVNSISRGYHTAREALLIGSKILDDHEPAFFLDLEAYRLLYDFKDSNGIRHFYQRTFAKLLEYDEETGNELTKTLETYLLCGYAKNKTASRLHIHRNSLNYRLKKIEEIMGQSLDEGVHLFAYQLASVIHKLLS